MATAPRARDDIERALSELRRALEHYAQAPPNLPQGDERNWAEIQAEIAAIIDGDFPVGRRAAATPPSGSQGVDVANENDLMDAKVAAAEARTDTKIARIEGKLDLVVSKLDSLREDNRAARANQWVIGFGLAVLIVAVAALFPVFFDLGSKVRDMVDHAVQSHMTPSKNP